MLWLRIRTFCINAINLASMARVLPFCIFVLLIFVFISVIFVLRSEYRLADEALDGKIQYTNKLIEDMVIADIWVIDKRRLVKDITELTVADNEINYIRVINNEGLSAEYVKKIGNNSGEIIHTIDLIKQDFDLGQLIISYSTAKNEKRKAQVKQFISAAIAILLLITGLVYFYRRNQKEIYKASVIRYRSIFKNLTDPVLEFSVSENVNINSSSWDVKLLNINTSANNYFKKLDQSKNKKTKSVETPSFIIEEVQKFVTRNTKNSTKEVNFNVGKFEHTLRLNFYKYLNLDINSTIAILSFSDLTTIRSRARDEKLMLQQQYSRRHIEDIDKLTGEIAHDINNILFSIMGYVDYARLSKDKNSNVNYLSGIEKACVSAKNIVSQILMSSRDKKKGVRVINVVEACREALGFARAGISDNIEIRTNFQCQHAYIRLNQTNISQLILNLCTNSSHAMDGGVGEIKLSVNKIELSGDEIPNHKYSDTQQIEFVEIKVSDNGSGIKAENLSKLYEPYFTTKPADIGFGLGLSLVFGIVSNADGFISVNSTEGQGATFMLYFPTVQKPDQNTKNYSNELLSLPAQVKTILFLDDNEAVTNINVELLKNLGFEVIPFLDPNEALEVISKSPGRIDLLISDVVMPKLSGVELLEKLNALNITIPTILISGYNDLQKTDDLTKYGVQKSITKPFNIHELYAAICSIKLDR